tara:strand:+ start:212 stop:352 length:141 start_codon:yes stop_codon:yes gene_type:complete
MTDILKENKESKCTNRYKIWNKQGEYSFIHSWKNIFFRKQKEKDET